MQAETDATPHVKGGAASIGRVCRTLHVIYSELESRGVTLATVTPYRHRRLGFKRGEDEVCLMIEEPLARIKRAPTPEELKRPSSEWKLETVPPSGQFRMIVLECEQHWTNRILNRSEGPRRPLPCVPPSGCASTVLDFATDCERRWTTDASARLAGVAAF